MNFATHRKTVIPQESKVMSDLLTTKEVLLANEKKGRLASNGTKTQTEISDKMRVILVDWLIKVHRMFKFLPTTWFLTIEILDSYIAREQIKKTELQLVGISSLNLASRLLEIYGAEVNDYVFICDNAYTSKQIIDMGEKIFKTLGCDIDFPNELHYITYASAIEESNLEEHTLVKNIATISVLRDLDILPSLRVSGIRYIVCKALDRPFVNVFEINMNSVIGCAKVIVSILRKLKKSTFNEWKKIVKLSEQPQWIVDVSKISALDIQPKSIKEKYKKSNYFQRNLELDLFPMSTVTDWNQLTPLGEGTYGVVKKLSYRKQDYAVKLHSNYEDDDHLSNSFLREVSFLHTLKHPNIIELMDISDDLSSIFLELGTSDADAYIKSVGVLDFALQLKVARQLLSALAYIHDNGCLHRDIKPKNIIVFDDGVTINCKLSDFGSTRGSNIVIRSNAFTHEVCTLWYRSPEILLGANNYGDRLDVWSILCTLYELAIGVVLFQGDSEISQLFKIFTVMGTPDETTWPGVSSLKDYNSDKFPKWKPKEDYFDKNVLLSNCYKDLLNTGLVLDPFQRPRSRALLDIVDDYISGKKI